MGNVYLEKIAKELETRQKVGLAEIGVLGTGGGLYLANDAYNRGHLTGRETLWHGTSKANHESILDKGLMPGARKGSTAALEEATQTPKGSFGSDKLVFTSPSRMYANTYRRVQEMAEGPDGSKKLHDYLSNSDHPQKNQGTIIKDYVKDRLTGNNKGMVKMNLPSWKPDAPTRVEDPEFTRMKSSVSWLFADPLERAAVTSHMENDRAVFEGGVAAEHMPASPHYKGNSLKEIREYVKANPKRFLVQGVGKTALGTGLVIGSPLAALGLKHHIEKQAASSRAMAVHKLLNPTFEAQ